MAVLDKLLGNLGSLTDDELAELTSRLEVEKSSRLKKEEVEGLMMEGGKVVACPACGSVDVVKCGKYDGKQRYKCKDCKKYFTQTTGTVFSHTRLNREQWLELIRGIVLNLSITKIADNIGVSGKCVWYNKQKVLYVLQEMFSDQDQFVGVTECDEYSVHLSFKGKKDPRFFVYFLGRMPRHHRSYYEKEEYLKKAGLWDELQKDPERLEMLLNGDRYLPGTNKDSVCILTGKDLVGNLYVAPVCVGNIESGHVIDHFDDKFSADTIMVTDGSHAYQWFAEERRICHQQVISTKHTNGPFSLAHINSLHSSLSAHWPEGRENLPATKYLDLGLMLFWWLEKNKDLNTNKQVQELYSYIQTRLADPITYQELKTRKFPVDGKGLLPIKI